MPATSAGRATPKELHFARSGNPSCEPADWSGAGAPRIKPYPAGPVTGTDWEYVIWRSPSNSIQFSTRVTPIGTGDHTHRPVIALRLPCKLGEVRIT